MINMEEIWGDLTVSQRAQVMETMQIEVPWVVDFLLSQNDAFFEFVPRPDDPANFDQQAGFCESMDDMAWLIGGNAAGCLGAEQPVYDPVAGEYRVVSEIDGPFHVVARTESGKYIVAEASKPKIYGVEDLYRVTLSTGESFISTLGHRVLDSQGTYREVGMLLQGQCLESAEGYAFPATSWASRLFAGLHSRTETSDQVKCRFVHTTGHVQDTIAAFSQSAIPGVSHCSSSVWDAEHPALHQRPRQSSAACGLEGILRSHAGQHDRFDSPEVPGSQFDYRSCLRFDDGRLPDLESDDRCGLTLQGDVREPAPCNWRSDDRGYSARHNRPLLFPGHLASSDYSGPQSQFVLCSSALDRPSILNVEFLRRDEYWDFTVKEHHNYVLCQIVHSNTTECAAFKTSLFLLTQQLPPRLNTPFWILSNTYDQTCETCWQEKLLGHGHIPESEIQWDKVSWIDKKKGWPASVPLKPWPKEFGGDPDKNWRIEFKSFEQGRTALQARSIGGFWFSEQFPVEIFLEVFRGCRETMFKGGQFAEFTPIDPDLCVWVEKMMEQPPDGWNFYRANTEANRVNLADGWYEQFFATVPDEMVATRMTGELASFEGAIFQGFNRAIHTTKELDFPDGITHFRAVDWGASVEHPFVCLWGYVDGQGDWKIYDEYWDISQMKILRDHIKEILEISEAWEWPKPETPSIWHRDCFADPSRPDNINEFNQEGIFTSPASNAVFRGIDRVRTLLKPRVRTGVPRLVIHERCKHLIEEMRKYRWRRGSASTGRSVLNPAVAAPIPLKKDDDCVDALRYMLYSEYNRKGEGPDRFDQMKNEPYYQKAIRRATSTRRH